MVKRQDLLDSVLQNLVNKLNSVRDLGDPNLMRGMFYQIETLKSNPVGFMQNYLIDAARDVGYFEGAQHHVDKYQNTLTFLKENNVNVANLQDQITASFNEGLESGNYNRTHYRGTSIGDFFKQVAPLALMFVPGMQGIGASLGTALGASGAAAAGLGNAIIQGALTEAQGGDFLKGAALSGIGSIAGGVIQPGLSEALGGGAAGNIASNALIGGGMSELSGGDFVQGALISGIGSGINEAKLAAASDYLDSLPGGQGVYTDDLPDMSDFDVPPVQSVAPPTIDDVISDLISQQPPAITFPPSIAEVPDVVIPPTIQEILDDIVAQAPERLPEIIDDIPEIVITASRFPSNELQPTVIDTSFTPDYSLSISPTVIQEMGAQGIQVPTINEVVDVVGQSVDYSLPIPDDGLGLQMPTAPNLDAMGGGQGIIVPVSGGTLTEAGVIPPDFSFDLGDPNSFINQPNLETAETPLLVPEPLPLEQEQPAIKPVDIDGELALLNAAKALTPLIVGALVNDQQQPTEPTETPTGFPILPVPSDWRSPEYSQTFTRSKAIDFGDLAGQFTRKAPVAAPSFYSLSDVINALNFQSVPFTQQQVQMPRQTFEMPDILKQFQTPNDMGMNDLIGEIDGTPMTLNSIIAGIQRQYG